MFKLHRRTSHGVYHHMGDFETDYVTIAFKDCVADHTGSFVWITKDDEHVHQVNYDPSVDNYLEVDDWVINL